jgi:hypothetical protein
LAFAGLALLLSLPATVPAGDQSELLLQVIRLKPGETRAVELATADARDQGACGQFRPFGNHRYSLGVEVLPGRLSGKKPTPVKAESKEGRPTGRYVVSADFVVVWAADRPAVEFQAGKAAGPSTTDLRLAFDGIRVPGEFVAGFRVVVETSAADHTGSTVKGTVRIDGKAPTPQEWKLEGAMQRVTGEKVYREETWLVGENNGLANCVVTLKAKKPADRVVPKPLKKAIVDKVGVRYVPRVLVVTPGTQVVFRNKESPCKGFEVTGNPLRAHNFNYMIPPGTEQTVTMGGRDTCRLRCPVRPYAIGYLLVVDTPYFAVTQSTGDFTIRGMPAGEYEVTVWHEAAGKLTKDAGPLAVTLTGKGDATLHYRVKAPQPMAK